MDNLTLRSPAKINLRLEILKKRDDGYHEIRTILQKISLFDEINLKLSSENTITVTTNNPAIPSGKENLAYKAASLLINDQKLSTGLTINIKKNIPSGAGLGGGSSNAATTLQCINRLLNLNLRDEYLKELSVSLGADVPFFLSGLNTAIATGIGEIIHPLNLSTKLWIIVIFPNLCISTAWAYSSYSKYNLLTKQKKNIILKNSISSVKDASDMLANDFEEVVGPKYPEIKTARNNLLEAGASGVLLSGSGSSVFGIFATWEEAKKASKSLSHQNKHKTFLVHSIK